MLIAQRQQRLHQFTFMDSNSDLESNHFKILVNENNDVDAQLEIEITDDSNRLFPRNSPSSRSISEPSHRLHFIKFIKRQGRTVKLWECGICGKDFRHQSYLIRHLTVHTGEKRFHCSVCEKSFSQMSSLIQHKTTHSKTRPYVCDICFKTFGRASNLVTHQKTHISEKVFKCDQCDMSFHQKTNLQHHLFAHSGKKPYQCEDCEQSFNQLSNLKTHRQKHHPS